MVDRSGDFSWDEIGRTRSVSANPKAEAVQDFGAPRLLDPPSAENDFFSGAGYIDWETAYNGISSIRFRGGNLRFPWIYCFFFFFRFLYLNRKI